MDPPCGEGARSVGLSSRMSWALIDDGISNHPKFLASGPAASWLWLCGVTYCRRHHTRGFVPTAALPTLGVPSPRVLLGRLIDNRLWQEAEGGWLINGYEEFYGDETAEKAKKEGLHPKKVEAGRKGGLAKQAKRLAEASSLLPAEEQQNGVAHSDPVHSDLSTVEEHGAGAKPHPIKDFLALHESLFLQRFGQKPPKYSGRDAKIAQSAVDRYGLAEASEMLRLFMRSTDEFVLKAGFGLNVFETRLVRLVMDRAKPKAQPSDAWSCPHVDRCSNREQCKSATILGRPVRAAS